MLIGRILFTVLLVFGLGTGRGSTETIVYRGSSTIGKFMIEAAKVYRASDFDIDTRSESSGGEVSVAMGKAHIGGVARDVKPEILAKGVRQYLIGKDAIGILVHPANPVHRLTMAQLAGIFSGDITNWQAVGGPDLPIDVYITNTRSATRSVVQKKVLGQKRYGGRRIQTIRPDERIAAEVANNPGGIGQLSISLTKGTETRLIYPDGQAPTLENPNYPITRPLFLVAAKNSSETTKKFIRWTLGPEGQKVIRRHFISIPYSDENNGH